MFFKGLTINNLAHFRAEVEKQITTYVKRRNHCDGPDYFNLVQSPNIGVVMYEKLQRKRQTELVAVSWDTASCLLSLFQEI